MIILVEDFEWLMNLESSNSLDNEKWDDINIFMFNLDKYGSESTYKNFNGDKYLISPGLETWFIAAIPKTEFITDILNQYLIFIEKGNKYKNEFLSK